VNGHVTQRLSIRFPNAGMKTLVEEQSHLQRVTDDGDPLFGDDTAPAARAWDRFSEDDWLSDVARKKEIPLHRHTIWYYFGGMTLFLFGVQVATGILLLLYYRPSSENAFESVQFIITEVQFGWLIRSIHWSSMRL
jgi:cytochrome b6